MLENVEEFKTWGALTGGTAIKAEAGRDMPEFAVSWKGCCISGAPELVRQTMEPYHAKVS